MAEHRLDTAFYRGISTLYRLRMMRKGASCTGDGKCAGKFHTNTGNLLKIVRHSTQNNPADNLAATQETPPATLQNPTDPPILANPQALDDFVTRLETPTDTPQIHPEIQ